MKNLNSEVLNEMMLLAGRDIFSVYDIRRILENKSGKNINHDEVRKWVEFYYKMVGLNRRIGYHLPFSPPPQLYYVKGQDISKYDPNALKPVVKNLQPKKEYWYALLHKPSGQILTSKSNWNGFYRNRVGPAALRSSRKKEIGKDCEIVKYEVILTPVGN